MVVKGEGDSRRCRDNSPFRQLTTVRVLLLGFYNLLNPIV